MGDYRMDQLTRQTLALSPYWAEATRYLPLLRVAALPVLPVHEFTESQHHEVRKWAVAGGLLPEVLMTYLGQFGP